ALTYQGLFHFIVQQNGCSTWWLMKINLLRGYLLSATQHGNKPPSRHEAESLKRRAHHSPYTCTLTTLTFPENNPLIQTVHGKSV
ncbi:hypothetical protein, partial [Escherichia coli]